MAATARCHAQAPYGDMETHIMDPLTAWSRALRDRSLQDLPYKIETNEHGQLVMSPHKIRHGYFQSRIDGLLLELVEMPGRRAVEFAVETSMGIKVPDVVWISESRWAEIPDDAEASSIAPDICVEVLSTSNSPREIEQKRRLYFERGAAEVWTCDGEGHLRFYEPASELTLSALVPDFPVRIE